MISPVLYDNTDNDNGNNDVRQNEKSQAILFFDISKMSPKELNFDSFEKNFLTYYSNSNQQLY